MLIASIPIKGSAVIKRMRLKRITLLLQRLCFCRSQGEGSGQLASQFFSVLVSVAHLKPVISCHRKLAGLNALYPSTRRPLFTPGAQFRQGQRMSLRLNLHASVTEISYPPPDLEIQGAAAAAGSESNPLHTSVNHPSPSLHKWLHPGRLLACYESVGNGVAAASSAARHRQQIVEELAQ